MRGRIGVEELTEVLNRVFGTMLEIAFARGGTLLKFGGDALLLLFDGPDHPAPGRVAPRSRCGPRCAPPPRCRCRSVGCSCGCRSASTPGRSSCSASARLHHELIVTGPAATRTTADGARRRQPARSSSAPRRPAACPRAATKPGPAAARLLRWRRRRLAPSGDVARGASFQRESIEECVPVVLREHLAHWRRRVRAPDRHGGVHPLPGRRRAPRRRRARTPSPPRSTQLLSTVQVAADEEEVTFLASDLDEDGGKVILVSGVPRAQADDEGRMLRAIRMDRRLRSRACSLQIGVNHGHVVAGTIGSAVPRHVHGDGRHREPGRPADGGSARRARSTPPPGSSTGPVRSSMSTPCRRSTSRASRSRCRPTRWARRSGCAATADARGPVRRTAGRAGHGRRAPATPAVRRPGR